MTDHIDALAEKAAREIAEKLYRLHPEVEAEPDFPTWQKILEMERTRGKVIATPIIAAAIREAREEWRQLDPGLKFWTESHAEDLKGLAAERETLRVRVAELEKEKVAAKNLLAVLHRDGGHHTEAVGFIQSCKDGEQVRHDLLGRIAEVEVDTDRAKQAVDNWLKAQERAEQAEARVKELEALLNRGGHRADMVKEMKAEINGWRDNYEKWVKERAAAQSRILALEGALREAIAELCDLCKEHKYPVRPGRIRPGEWWHDVGEAQQFCKATPIRAAFAPQPQASGGEEKAK